VIVNRAPGGQHRAALGIADGRNPGGVGKA
jgi:hypothetical protein